MPESAPRLPVHLTRTDHVLWTLGCDGTFLSAEGEPLAKVGLKPSDIVGVHITKFYADHPNLLRAVQRLLKGTPICEFADFGGVYWLIQGTPIIQGGKVVAASGVSFALNIETPPVEAAPREQEWEVEDLPAGYRGSVEVGDRFLKVESVRNVGLGRQVSDGDFLAFLMEPGTRIRLVRDSNPPCPSPPPRPRLVP